MPFNLTGRVAVVTGGGRGIGAAIVTRLAEAGATVVAANRTRDVVDELAASLAARGLKVHAATLTGVGRAAIRALVDDVARQHGRLDIAIHNAGGCPWASVEEMDEERLEEALSVNLKAAFWLAQAAIPHMKRNRHGRILVTSSVSSRLAAAEGAHYSAAKAGVNAFIRGAAFELARDGITVNGVEPGWIAKARGRMSVPETAARIAAHVPMGKLGEGNDVAYAMLYLASDEAKYMTGQTIVVDGGATLPETGFAVEQYWGAK